MFLNSSATTWYDQILKQMKFGRENQERGREENMERERERREIKEKRYCGGKNVSVGFLKKDTLLHYLQLQKFSSSKMNLPIQILGYDARISSSISQVESPDMRSHNTFTMGILLPRSCFTCESKIMIDFTSNDKFSFTWKESNSRM